MIALVAVLYIAIGLAYLESVQRRSDARSVRPRDLWKGLHVWWAVAIAEVMNQK